MSTPHDPRDPGPIDPRLVDDYRRASELAGEVPSPSVRTAVLAAAQRAGGNITPLPTHPRSRMPLALAATIVLSSIAVMLATRVDKEQQAQTSASGTSSVPAPAPQSEPVPRPAAAPPSAAAPKPLPQISGSLERSRAAPKAVEQGGTRFEDAPRADRPIVAAKKAAIAPAPVAAPTSDAAGMEAPRATAPAPAAPAPAAMRESETAETRSAAKTDARYAHEDDPTRWLDYIKRLRVAGRDADADAQVQHFRERYPQIDLPPEALRRTPSP